MPASDAAMAALPMIYDDVSYRLLQKASNRRERLVEIGDEVGWILEPDRQPHQAVVDAQGAPFRRFEAVMGRGGGVRNQALAIGEIVRDEDEPERILEAERTLLAAPDRERHHRAAAAHLPRGERPLRMTFEP